MATSTRLPADFSRSAAYPLFAIDLARDEACILNFTRDDYRRASFLDARALEHRQVGGWVATRDDIAAAFAAGPAARLQWLFHIGHCGSTLCSRLLDLIPAVLGLREPVPLLTLAHAASDDVARWLPATLHMLARGFDDGDTVIVKPTSLVTTLSHRLLHMSEGRGCLLWVDLQTWLATILRDDTLRRTTLASAAMRSSGLADDPLARSDGEQLARIWLSEQMRWHALASDPDAAGRLIDLDFAAVLHDPAGAIAGLAAHYRLALPEDWRDRVATSGLLETYAKDQRQAFDAAMRQQELAAAATLHRDDIEAGVRWAEQRLSAQPANEWLAPRLRT